MEFSFSRTYSFPELRSRLVLAVTRSICCVLVLSWLHWKHGYWIFFFACLEVFIMRLFILSHWGNNSYIHSLYEKQKRFLFKYQNNLWDYKFSFSAFDKFYGYIACLRHTIQIMFHFAIRPGCIIRVLISTMRKPFWYKEILIVLFRKWVFFNTSNGLFPFFYRSPSSIYQAPPIIFYLHRLLLSQLYNCGFSLIFAFISSVTGCLYVFLTILL